MSTPLIKAEDGVYKVAGIVKEEAKVVERLAEHVEKLSTAVQADVDHVETFVHEVSKATEFIKEDVDKIDTTPLTSNETQDVLALGWPWSVFRVFLMILTLFVVLLHHWGTTVLDQDNMEPKPSSGNNFLSFSMLLMNPATIKKFIRSLRDAMTKNKNKVQSLEEDVIEIGENVKKMAMTVEGVANVVEHMSQQVQEEASQIQCHVEHKSK